MANDNVIILNQPGNLQRRIRSSGKVKYTVEVKSEPLIHDFDPKTLGGGVATAIAEALRRKVLEISAVAAPATLRARATAAKAFAAGASWSQKRYGGGRIGPMAPNQSDRMFNDSGRMAKSIAASQRDDSWIVTMAANRLDPATATGGSGGVQRIYRRLVELVPAFANTALLFEEQSVQKALVTSVEGLIVKAQETRDHLLETRARAALQLFRQGLSAFRLAG